MPPAAPSTATTSPARPVSTASRLYVAIARWPRPPASRRARQASRSTMSGSTRIARRVGTRQAQQRHQAHRRRDRQVGQRIERADAVQLGRQPARQHQRPGDTGREAGRAQHGALAQHQPAHVARQRARARRGSRTPASAATPGTTARHRRRGSPAPARAAPSRPAPTSSPPARRWPRPATASDAAHVVDDQPADLLRQALQVAADGAGAMRVSRTAIISAGSRPSSSVTSAACGT